MNEYSETILTYLTESLKDITSNSRAYTVNPETDFTRERKLPLSEITRIILSMGGQSHS